MADIFCKYDTGNDTTGDGSVGNPYKTAAKALTVHAAGDSIILMADETLSSGWTLPTYTDYTKPNRIIGATAAGSITGVRRALNGNSAVTNLAAPGANTYPWSFENISFENFTGHVFATSVAWSNGPLLINCRILNGKGLSSSSNYRLSTCIDCEFDSCAGAAGEGLFTMYAGRVMRCKFINCVAQTSGYILGGSTGGVLISDVVFKNCQVSAQYLAGAISDMFRVIFSDCVQNGSTASGMSQVLSGAIVEDVLYRNNVGNSNSSSALLTFGGNSAINLAANIAFYGNTVFNSLIRSASTTKATMLNAPISLSSDPMADGTNLIYDPTYAWRRVAEKIGEFNYLPTVI